MDLSELAALTSGASFWVTKAGGDLPATMLIDGPHGVRAQGVEEGGVEEGGQLGIAPSRPATCFPPAAGLAQCWDPEVVERVGAALGREARAYGVGVLLGPGVNIKRDPRCGRNFEYYSEDPYLTGELGAAWVRGLQGEGVGASVKHFAANNAEHDRMRSSSEVDVRALREIYLRAFQRIVTSAKPWTVMCSYNRVNGVYAAESRWLLTEVLRGEWGFDGVVVSDWGAVRDRPTALAAGLDLAMPGGAPQLDQAVVEAVHSGQLSQHQVRTAANRVLDLLRKAAAAQPSTVDHDAHHALARDAAARSIVLLKNDGGLLPLAPGSTVAVSGPFAREPRYQGGGSSHVTPTRLDIPADQIGAYATLTDDIAAAEAAIVFLGLPEEEESEGFDREHIDLPADQLDLLRRTVAVQPRTVAVLSHGGVVDLSEVARLAPAILDGALLGQAGGGAIAEVLFGHAEPTGRLAETVPARLQDAPAYLSFPGDAGRVRYGEGIHVGYRWYDARDIPVTFPFGHGLSYTSFAYADLRVSADRGGITAQVTVTNTGERAGHEVVQFYVAKPDSAVRRAPRELKAFRTVHIGPGQSAEVEVCISRNDLIYWDERLGTWMIEPGTYEVIAAASSRDLRQRSTVDIGRVGWQPPLTLESTVGEVLRHPVAGPLLGELIGIPGGTANEALGTDMARMMAAIPLDRMVSFTAGYLDHTRLQAILDQANT